LNYLLSFLDAFLLFLHLAVILFNLVGWIWPSTRRLHQVFVVGTALSWFGGGIFYGWGYCFLTDWHWQVKRELGETNLPSSFIKYLADNFFCLGLSPSWADFITGLVFALIVAVTIYKGLKSK